HLDDRRIVVMHRWAGDDGGCIEGPTAQVGRSRVEDLVVAIGRYGAVAPASGPHVEKGPGWIPHHGRAVVCRAAILDGSHHVHLHGRVGAARARLEATGAVAVAEVPGARDAVVAAVGSARADAVRAGVPGCAGVAVVAGERVGDMNAAREGTAGVVRAGVA